MLVLQSILYFIVSFLASTVGAICGMGGGIIIKPVLDVFGWENISTISFLSGCTVLAMSLYSVIRLLRDPNKKIDIKKVTFLAVGAALGGVVGKQLFQSITLLYNQSDTVGVIQAICLIMMTVMTFIYTLLEERIKTYQISNPIIIFLVGFSLGMVSSFLGIGGGPMNLVVLSFFFSMEMKTAVTSSLYIILFSQITSLLFSVSTNSVPSFSSLSLFCMIAGGIIGGIVGVKVNKTLHVKMVRILFLSIMVVIVMINLYNFIKYMF